MLYLLFALELFAKQLLLRVVQLSLQAFHLLPQSLGEGGESQCRRQADEGGGESRGLYEGCTKMLANLRKTFRATRAEEDNRGKQERAARTQLIREYSGGGR